VSFVLHICKYLSITPNKQQSAAVFLMCIGLRKKPIAGLTKHLFIVFSSLNGINELCYRSGFAYFLMPQKFDAPRHRARKNQYLFALINALITNKPGNKHE